MTEFECDDTAACAAGFMLGDDFYRLSCGAVRPDAVSDHLLGAGTLGDRDVEVRAVQHVDPQLFVAVSLPGGECDAEDTARSPWSVAYPPNSSESAERADRLCAAVVDEHQERNDCPAGSQQQPG